MKLDDLRSLGLDELETGKAPYTVAANQLRAELREKERVMRLYDIARCCLAWGVWIGDKVQITGKIAGKTNPTGYVRGFEHTDYGNGWPLVHLILANGKESENSSRVCSDCKLTKIE